MDCDLVKILGYARKQCMPTIKKHMGTVRAFGDVYYKQVKEDESRMYSR